MTEPTALKKEAIVPTWLMEDWMRGLPRGPEYAVKYSVFDAC